MTLLTRRNLLKLGAIGGVATLVDLVLESKECGLISLIFRSNKRIYIEKPNENIQSNFLLFNKTCSVLEKQLKAICPDIYDFITEKKLRKWKMHSFIDPVDTEPDNMSIFNFALEKVKEEFTDFGIDTTDFTNYKFKIIRNKSDLEENNKDIIYIVGNIGEEIESEFEISYPKGKKGMKLSFEHLRGGISVSNVSFVDDKTVFKKSDIFVLNSKDEIEIYLSIYSELLHSYTTPQKEEIVNKFIKKIKENAYANCIYATTAMVITDQSVVHGLCNNWIEENTLKFNLDKKKLNERIVKLESDLEYVGCKFMNDVVKLNGRKKIFNDYTKDPLKYWGFLKQLKEYRTIEQFNTLK